VATPILTLFLDIKKAVVLLILPNIVMDALQFRRVGTPWAMVRRMALLIIFGGVGMVVGTRLLVWLSPRTTTLILGLFVLGFVALALSRFNPRVAPNWEPWLSPVVGFVGGLLGGITNVPGTPLVLYFHALGLAKREYLSAVALTFLTYKAVQLGTVAAYGLLTWPLFGMSIALTAVALLGFRGGLVVQDRLDQRAFNFATIIFLAIVGAWLVVRSM
jgi:uncharacterized membrane protein YfcA